MSGRIFIDTFTCLDELKGRDRGDPEKILAVLAETGRFSCFDVDRRMAKAMTWLCNESGWITTENYETVKDPDGYGSHKRDLYPWTLVALTDAGRAALNPQISLADALKVSLQGTSSLTSKEAK